MMKQEIRYIRLSRFLVYLQSQTAIWSILHWTVRNGPGQVSFDLDLKTGILCKFIVTEYKKEFLVHFLFSTSWQTKQKMSKHPNDFGNFFLLKWPCLQQTLTQRKALYILIKSKVFPCSQFSGTFWSSTIISHISQKGTSDNTQNVGCSWSQLFF